MANCDNTSYPRQDGSAQPNDYSYAQAPGNSFLVPLLWPKPPPPSPMYHTTNSCRNASAYDPTEPLSNCILVPFHNPKDNSRDLSNAGKRSLPPVTHSVLCGSAFFQDGDPREACLVDLQEETLKEQVIVIEGKAILGVVIIWGENVAGMRDNVFTIGCHNLISKIGNTRT